eukprot:c24121_g2_i1 orf=378-758(+)
MHVFLDLDGWFPCNLAAFPPGIHFKSVTTLLSLSIFVTWSACLTNFQCALSISAQMNLTLIYEAIQQVFLLTEGFKYSGLNYIANFYSFLYRLSISRALGHSLTVGIMKAFVNKLILPHCSSFSTG